MNRLLPKKFFERSAVEVAEDLIGKYLVSKKYGKFLITETEAYEGIEDLASHASKGRTKRTEVMFGEAGRFYVYLVYGMYEMLNVVTGPKGHPAAVLIRGARKIEKLNEGKIEILRKRKESKLNGPGKLTKKLDINRSLNNLPAIPKTRLWFEESPLKINKKLIEKTPRIGVTYAGPLWSNKLWRFVYKV